MLIDVLRADYQNRFVLVPSYAWALKYDPDQPRDRQGRWARILDRMATLKLKHPAVAKNYPRSTRTEMGTIEAHTFDVGREWEKQLTDEELSGISERFGSDVGKLMETAIPLHDIGKAEAIESGEGKEAQHKHTIPIMQDVLRKEHFSEKDITLATELLNHDLIGPLFRGYEGFKAQEADVVTKLQEKAQKVGMNVADFVTLQLAFYQADAAAYPYITQFMRQEPSGKWTFSGNPKIAAIEALTKAKKREYVRDEKGQFAETGSVKPDFDPAKKETWYNKGGDWQRSVHGESPYGWIHTIPADYEPPTRTHELFREPNAGWWGGSHSGSSAITGEAAKQMGLQGWKDHGASEESQSLARQMLTRIADDKTGSEEPLYHAFQNTRGTVFTPSDTFDLPLAAAAGEPAPLYAMTSAAVHQQGAPTVFVFAKGTPMVGYSTLRERDLEDAGHATIQEANKEKGYLWDEAIVAGRFKVDRVETVYMGSQWTEKFYYKEGEPIMQIYGQVVYVTPTHTFDLATKTWVPIHG